MLYGSGQWAIKAKDTNKIGSVEMRHWRTLEGCTKLDHIRNDNIGKELNIPSLQYKTDELRQNWINHLDSIADERIRKKDSTV